MNRCVRQIQECAKKHTQDEYRGDDCGWHSIELLTERIQLRVPRGDRAAQLCNALSLIIEISFELLSTLLSRSEVVAIRHDSSIPHRHEANAARPLASVRRTSGNSAPRTNRSRRQFEVLQALVEDGSLLTEECEAFVISEPPIRNLGVRKGHEGWSLPIRKENARAVLLHEDQNLIVHALRIKSERGGKVDDGGLRAALLEGK